MTNQPELSSESSSGSLSESFGVNELCLLAELPLRTVRYYIQQGLVDRPLAAHQSGDPAHRGEVPL